jgi:pyruvate kinase
MARIAEGTEATLDEFRFHPPMKVRDDVKSCALARAAVRAAAEVDARCIVAFTLSGRMARLLARERGLTPVLACARDPATLRRLGLVWGVRAVALESSRTVTDMARLAREAAAASRLARVGDTFVALAGSHDVPGGAYALRIDHVTARDARSRAGLARTL